MRASCECKLRSPRPRKRLGPDRLTDCAWYYFHVFSIIFPRSKPTKYSSQLPVCRFVSNCSYLRVSRARVTNYLSRRGYFMWLMLTRRIAAGAWIFDTNYPVRRLAKLASLPLFLLPKNPLLLFVLIFMKRLF